MRSLGARTNADTNIETCLSSWTTGRSTITDKERIIMANIRNKNFGLDHSRVRSNLNRSSGRSTLIKLTRNYILNFRNLTVAICFVFLALSAQAQTADIDRSWTTVGSTGTLDESSVGKVFLDHSIVQMGRVVGGTTTTAKRRASIFTQTQSAVIRYNVTPVDSFFVLLRCSTTPSPGITLRLRYLAAGSSARVVAKLIEVDLATGQETTHMTFDSRGGPLSDKYQVGLERACGRQPFVFDFKRKGYYIEATLTTAATIFAINSAAGIQTITIENSSSGNPN
jgi:hypothetical protein